MYCNQCHFILQEQKFCPQCGTPTRVTKTCPNCHKECSLDSNFCGECGTSLVTQPKPIQPMANRKDSEAIKKHVSILFADIKESTSAISNLDPEEARNLLSPAIEKMLNAVYQYSGTIIHTAGDGIVAIFGAPQALEDHAFRACLAANFMQTQLNALPLGLKIRVGLNSGEILMDVVGRSEQHLEYDITGAAVNLAARMEQTATPGNIQITKHTLILVKDAVEVESIGRITIKGFSEPVEVFKLKGIKDESNLISLKYRPTFTPFVGRNDTIKKLNELLDLAEAGQGSMVCLEAEAGQGKSRVIYELLNNNTSLQIIYSGGFSHLCNVTLFPIVQLFRKLLDIHQDDLTENIYDKVCPYTKDLTVPYATDAALSLLNSSGYSKAWEKLAPQLKHKYLFLIGIAILTKACTNKTLVLIIEDLHWIDNETENFISLLLNEIHKLKILLIGTYRPSFNDTWLKNPNYHLIKLGPIPQKHLKTLADIILGTHPSINSLKKDILHACSGNPFFIQEIIDSLIADNLLTGRLGNYQLDTVNFAKRSKLPESIFALLQTKIDKLPAHQKELLEIASVIGERFPYTLIAQLSTTENKVTRKNLNQLTALNYIYEAQLYPDLEFSFSHALIQEVLYNTLLKKVRHQIHLKILEFFECLPEDQKKEKIQILANHAYLGQHWEKAFYYCAQAAEKTFIINALKLTIQYSKQAIEAAAYIKDQSSIIDSLIMVHIDMMHAYLHLGLPEEQGPILEKILKLSVEAKRPAVKCAVYGAYATFIMGISCPQHAEPFLEKANQYAKESKRQDLMKFVDFAFLLRYTLGGDYIKGQKIGRTFLAQQASQDFFCPEFRLNFRYVGIIILMINQLTSGAFLDFDRQIEFYSTCFNLTEPSIYSAGITTALGTALVQKGDFSSTAERYLHLAIYYLIEVNFFLILPLAQAALALLYLNTKRLKEGKEQLEKAQNSIELVGYYLSSNYSVGFIAEGLLLSGQLTKADKFIQNALALSEKRNLKGNMAWLKRLSAEIALKKSKLNPLKIKNLLEEALILTKETHMKIQEGKCHLTLAKYYQISKHNEMAVKEEKLAYAIFKQIGYKL
ncbi:adenylate cyclase [Legionella beliardensis]|uniref:Adenylate cyclase n=2 Tax=Legionella beliardensis TaxID=91822 RepID=A0A378I3D7_9GAMM|nr:adenylate/guanylate cyclase domain-containing protein [Legionella beliardensis]STX29280.1 adenylate cyclase [Legionella beliardensis]